MNFCHNLRGSVDDSGWVGFGVNERMVQAIEIGLLLFQLMPVRLGLGILCLASLGVVFFQRFTERERFLGQSQNEMVVWFFLLFLSNLASLPFLNFQKDLNQARFIRDFHHLPQLPDSILLQEKVAFGLLGGNSNHCDYYVGQLRVSPQKPAEVTAFYSRVFIPMAEPKGDVYPLSSPIPANFLPLGLDFEPLKIYNLHIGDWKIDPQWQKKYPNRTFYLIEAQDIGNTHNDWRCH